MEELKKEYSPIESLKEEVERFYNTNTFSPLLVTNFYAQAKIVISDYEQLKAENEKLKTKLKDAHEVVIDLKNAITVNAISRKDELSEARKETKEAIEKVLMKRLMDGSIDFISINATQLSKEFDVAIEPQQSCEGCEHLQQNLSIGAPFCTKSCEDFSNYQAKEK